MPSVAEVANKLDVLRRHCDDLGRDYDSIQKTANHNGLVTDQDAFVAQMADYAKLGIETVIVMPPGDAPAKYVDEVVAPLVPRIAEL
jgi:hypothetical protein